MEYLLLLIPISFSILFLLYLYVINKQKILYKYIKKYRSETIFTLSLPALISLVIITSFSIIVKSCNIDDVEYLGFYVTKIKHVDSWNEYIHKTCSDRVPCGTRTYEDSEGNEVTETEYKTVYYDCSYVENYPDRWIKVTNAGDEIYISQEEFNSIKNLWKSPGKIINMHRNYYTKNGNMQEYAWPGTKSTIQGYTKEHPYSNYIKGSAIAIKSKHFNKDEARKLGLYEYPTVENGIQPTILGGKPSAIDKRCINYLNSFYGKSKQFRMYIIIFDGTKASQTIAQDQASYWQGGNKNEFNICIGINPENNVVLWSYCFSWMDDQTMISDVTRYLSSQYKLDIPKLSSYIEKEIKSNKWERKEFKDFKNIKIILSSNQLNILFCIILIISIIYFGSIIYILFKHEKIRNI